MVEASESPACSPESPPASPARTAVVLGVLALQGAFEEHQKLFDRLQRPNVRVVQVRTPSELSSCSALVIPGGESTTLRIIAQADNGAMMEALKQFVHADKKPVWGTCAGAILLSSEVISGQDVPRNGEREPARDKYGEFLGGVDVRTSRNFFGRQKDSFEAPLVGCGAYADIASGFNAVCIRAPAILQPLSDDVEVIAHLPPAAADPSSPKATSDKPVIAAASQGHLFITIFHPELTEDARFHAFFLDKFVLPRTGGAAPR
ncbi:unnamed protein product [Vitrella brassicaformis CCMP3155]|uniref:glutaminase n=1 Tax=Vitrella brassicaformis (strain CCMP3155) TaxID=1169540 RepID=A0A0G4GJP9_VITBC|nr:unnamed protein product [Vitrella brassicaformis CCMP3155]|eukprot:CEM30146.1 unnamed protein product [Vitrella brassicaformis CCMP3155]